MADNISITDTDTSAERISITMSDEDNTQTITLSDNAGDYDSERLTLCDSDYVTLENRVTTLEGDCTDLEDRVATLENTSARLYVHEQAISSDTWDIQHGLNTFPYNIMIMDSSGSIFEPVWEFPYIDGTNQLDPNRVIVSFNGATTGKAFFNY